MEPLCKTCCNGMCPLQGGKDGPLLSCIEYIPGIIAGEVVDRSNKYSKKEIELASEVSSLKVQIEFIKGQASDIREAYAKVAKEALALAGEYKKENEEMKRLLKLISEETDCLATFQHADKIEKLIGGNEK